MAKMTDETASFVLRFTQKIYEDEQGESQVQWRGNIRYVQGGEEERFSEFPKVVNFIQDKLAKLTIQAMEDKPIEQKESILSKSFDLWKRMATTYPSKIIETIKDPESQIKSIQEQVQEQVSQIGEVIEQGLDPNSWRPASKADHKQMMQLISDMSANLKALNEKVDKLSSSNT